MTANGKTIFTILAVLLAGFIANFSLSIYCAPGHVEAAFLVGILLTSFGLMFARYSMDAVMFPFAVITFVWRLVRRQALIATGKKRDGIEIFGRILFVLSYSLISSLGGIYVGAMEGGSSWLAAGLCFSVLGFFLALLVPDELMWAVDSDTNPTPEVSQTGLSKREAMQDNNDPVSKFSRKVARGIVDVVTANPSSGDKNNQA